MWYFISGAVGFEVGVALTILVLWAITSHFDSN